MTFSMIWIRRPELDEALRDLCTVKNFSSSDIAWALNERFGTSFTRNAIIGRLHRLGLKTSHPRSTPRIGPRPKRVQIRGPRKPKQHTPLSGPIAKPLSAAVACEAVEPLPAGVSLLELAPNGCRWPEGTGPYVFCNQPQGAARVDRYGNLHSCSYCDDHAAIAFGPGTTSERTAHYGVT